ncbi:MAG: hypothetical protein A2527_14245 [Candidatus Lambdaproteobacteria bacterium RIFOXYD2_FULL_50_16]|uniref:Uncharacterized protein n=1 Tax=Candidatus Lambdaproteobacteria bacterium RIFOXYD2_FULL_50_16 TaxID=1817772 RepID=A0A1F6G4Q5_9PROT|nr:MAG: hypothetical protein A2527_14245 [Candidatus Lambdaproteobacteria bacterium RIFOXYD2_FULL_50_16]
MSWAYWRDKTCPTPCADCARVYFGERKLCRAGRSGARVFKPEAGGLAKKKDKCGFFEPKPAAPERRPYRD